MFFLNDKLASLEDAVVRKYDPPGYPMNRVNARDALNVYMFLFRIYYNVYI